VGEDQCTKRRGSRAKGYEIRAPEEKLPHLWWDEGEKRGGRKNLQRKGGGKEAIVSWVA